MPVWILYPFIVLALGLIAIASFFFAVTKGALLLRGAGSGPRRSLSNVYPIYSDMRLIRLVDFQPVISAILLFQYDRLVSMIAAELRRMALRDKDVLITSCAFGNVMPRVVEASIGAGAQRVLIVDIIKNELEHAKTKLPTYSQQVEYSEGDATAMTVPSGSVAANVLFFLLHELPPDMKRKALAEAARVLMPGGKLFLAEFHRPDAWPLRALSWTYFKVFEPFGLALWDVQDPVDELNAIGGLVCERQTALVGNFQVVIATKT